MYEDELESAIKSLEEVVRARYKKGMDVRVEIHESSGDDGRVCHIHVSDRDCVARDAWSTFFDSRMPSASVVAVGYVRSGDGFEVYEETDDGQRIVTGHACGEDEGRLTAIARAKELGWHVADRAGLPFDPEIISDT